MKKIQILGTGCPKCQQLYANARKAADELKLECQIEKVTDLKQIMAFGVMSTPALAVDGKVQFSGKVPEAAAIKLVLQ
jgi:small redox-active disulfide protein 2